MPYIRKHEFDKEVILKINAYIFLNDLSYSKIAEATGMTYQQLYQLLHNNQVIKLREYVKLCKAFNEPLEFFLEGVEDK